VSQTVWEVETTAGHHLEITWTGAQTALPTGALDNESPRRTRYFFDVIVDGLYYFGNRFLTSSDAEGRTDARGTPLLARTDLFLRLCGDRVAEAVEAGNMTSLPNDLGYIDIDSLVATDVLGADDARV
jgi:hypothetical protein